jgi:hypothetical protein
MLAEHFVKYAEANGLPVPSLTEEARRARRPMPGRATCASWRTPCTAPSCSPTAIPSAPTSSCPAAGHGRRRGAGDRGRRAASAVGRGRHHRPVGRTVADVERDLILDTLHHCLGNRTHAANILGISIRTLRNKLRQYTSEGFPVPMPGEGERTRPDPGCTRCETRHDRRPSPDSPRDRRRRQRLRPAARRAVGARRHRACPRRHRHPGGPHPADAALAARPLLAFSITFSVLVLMTALFIEKPLEFNAFPTVLLIATMLRLALNLASTRLILANGHEGPDAAGRVIEAFGGFIMGQLRHRADRLRHPGDRQLRGHHQGLGPHRRGRGALLPRCHAGQADGDRRRPLGRPHRRGHGARRGARSWRRRAPSSAPWTAPPSSSAAMPSPAC